MLKLLYLTGRVLVTKPTNMETWAPKLLAIEATLHCSGNQAEI